MIWKKKSKIFQNKNFALKKARLGLNYNQIVMNSSQNNSKNLHNR